MSALIKICLGLVVVGVLGGGVAAFTLMKPETYEQCIEKAVVVHKERFLRVAQKLNADGNLFGNMASQIAATVKDDVLRTNLVKHLPTLQACQLFIR